MKILFFISFSLLFATSLLALEPQLIVDSDPHNWINPIYSNDGLSLAFTTFKQDRIWSFDLINSRKPSHAARGDSIGRRFIFEPGIQDDRVVYRIRIKAHPDQPLRLLSTSIHLFDPVTRTDNPGEIIGPYLFENQAWYRHSLDGPFFDYNDQPRSAGPYWDRASSILWVQDEDENKLFTSPGNEPVRGFEISPDGSFAAVVATAPEPILYLVSLQSGERSDLGAGRWPAWSGDSEYLSCLVDIRDETIIRVHNIQKQEHKALDIASKFDPEYPALNSDGTKLVFVDSGRIFQVDLTE